MCRHTVSKIVAYPPTPCRTPTTGGGGHTCLQWEQRIGYSVPYVCEMHVVNRTGKQMVIFSCACTHTAYTCMCGKVP